MFPARGRRLFLGKSGPPPLTFASLIVTLASRGLSNHRASVSFALPLSAPLESCSSAAPHAQTPCVNPAPSPMICSCLSKNTSRPASAPRAAKAHTTCLAACVCRAFPSVVPATLAKISRRIASLWKLAALHPSAKRALLFWALARHGVQVVALAVTWASFGSTAPVCNAR